LIVGVSAPLAGPVKTMRALFLYLSSCVPGYMQWRVRRALGVAEPPKELEPQCLNKHIRRHRPPNRYSSSARWTVQGQSIDGQLHGTALTDGGVRCTVQAGQPGQGRTGQDRAGQGRQDRAGWAAKTVVQARPGWLR
jgi:hypothetical protein